jgi:hypothetical protein
MTEQIETKSRTRVRKIETGSEKAWRATLDAEKRWRSRVAQKIGHGQKQNLQAENEPGRRQAPRAETDQIQSNKGKTTLSQECTAQI